jgi:hypothetical protein
LPKGLRGIFVVGQGVAGLVALVIGLATGLFFERRARREAQRQNAELRLQLKEMEQTLYSVGGEKHPRSSPKSMPIADLQADVLQWAKRFQDAGGRIETRKAHKHFAELGYPMNVVDDALHGLNEARLLRTDGRWLVIL